jgi:hypothetical protein
MAPPARQGQKANPFFMVKERFSFSPQKTGSPSTFIGPGKVPYDHQRLEIYFRKETPGIQQEMTLADSMTVS